MSSSSDSEDDERFRAICDPTLSVNYGKNNSLADVSGGVQPQGKEEKLENEDDRPSFLLLKRIRRCTAADGAQIVRGMFHLVCIFFWTHDTCSEYYIVIISRG